MSKTAIWDALGKTDPAHTKSFSRAGGFKGTALKPMWMIKRLTEEFGPVGLGWGTGKPSYDIVRGEEGEVLVYCTVECWHTSRENTFYGVGGDKAIGRNKNGLFHDDEAFKKAFTDAVGNAFKFLGSGADIHMGQFDDSKYVQQMQQEFAPKPPTISEAQRTELMTLLTHLSVPAGEFLKVAKLKDLRELPAEKFEGAKGWINEQAKAKRETTAEAIDDEIPY